MVGDDLYKRGYGQPLLKCVTIEKAQYIIKELHEGICGYHSGARTMATRVLRAGYFWPTIEADCQDHVRKCKPCQKHGNLIHQKQEQLHHILSPWPFAKWGMDILDPFISKIPNCSRRLFYQMDRSQAANHHHGPASPAIRVEGHYMQIWCTTYHHHKQWPTIY